jgi:hypothetical protein
VDGKEERNQKGGDTAFKDLFEKQEYEDNVNQMKEQVHGM